MYKEINLLINYKYIFSVITWLIVLGGYYGLSMKGTTHCSVNILQILYAFIFRIIFATLDKISYRTHHHIRRSYISNGWQLSLKISSCIVTDF